MASGDGSSYFILLKEHTRQNLHLNKVYTFGKMGKGSIVMEGSVGLLPENNSTEQEKMFWSVDDKSSFIKCRKTHLELVTREILELLLPVKTPEERWRVYSDKGLLDFGLRQDGCVGEHVKIRFTSGKDGSGIIRHVGAVNGRNGTWFGLELDQV